MSESTPYVTVESDGMSFETNTASLADAHAALGVEAPAEIPDADVVAEATEPTPAAAGASADAPVSADPPKIDRRTREGRKSSIQAEIDALTATKRETERELAALEARFTRIREESGRVAHPASQPQPARQSGVVADPEPDPANLTKYPDGQYDRQYLKDQARWEARQTFAELNRQREEREAAERQQYGLWQEHRAWEERLATFKAKTPDWDARFKPDTPLHPETGRYLKLHDQGPELMLYLMDHQTDAQRIAALHPIKQIEELGKISARLEAAASGPAETRIPSNAKEPIKPVGTSPIVASDDYSDDEPLSKSYARYKKEKAAKAR